MSDLGSWISWGIYLVLQVLILLFPRLQLLSKPADLFLQFTLRFIKRPLSLLVVLHLGLHSFFLASKLSLILFNILCLRADSGLMLFYFRLCLLELRLELLKLFLNELLFKCQALYFFLGIVSPFFNAWELWVVFLGWVTDAFEIPFEGVVLLLQVVEFLSHSSHSLLLLLYGLFVIGRESL